MHLPGTPSDQLPAVLAEGANPVGFAFCSFSARHAEGHDAYYLAWHSLDHRPEQYRLPELRHALRLVSTPACRAERAASEGALGAVDHVMTYLFAGPRLADGFTPLGMALHEGGRMAIRLPSVGHFGGTLAGQVAAAEAVAGADVIGWRPALGVYLLVEEGRASPAALAAVPGVAGAWWFEGSALPEPYSQDSAGRQVTLLFLDRDPVATARALAAPLHERWASGAVTGLLAAPFFTVVPFEWDRHLP